MCWDVMTCLDNWKVASRLQSSSQGLENSLEVFKTNIALWSHYMADRGSGKSKGEKAGMWEEFINKEAMPKVHHLNQLLQWPESLTPLLSFPDHHCIWRPKHGKEIVSWAVFQSYYFFYSLGIPCPSDMIIVAPVLRYDCLRAGWGFSAMLYTQKKGLSELSRKTCGHQLLGAWAYQDLEQKKAPSSSPFCLRMPISHRFWDWVLHMLWRCFRHNSP